jgi:hypothetical protein
MMVRGMPPPRAQVFADPAAYVAVADDDGTPWDWPA